MAFGAANKVNETNTNTNTIEPKGKKDKVKEQVKVEAVVEQPKTTTTESSVVVDKNAEERSKIEKMTLDQRWAQFGGENVRGAISKAIRYYAAIGFDRAQIALLLGKRYQHVRNVLTEDARIAKSETK